MKSVIEILLEEFKTCIQGPSGGTTYAGLKMRFEVISCGCHIRQASRKPRASDAPVANQVCQSLPSEAPLNAGS